MPRSQPTPSVKPRPAVLRALGRDEPPEQITLTDRAYRRVTVYKHDSWAATSLYHAIEPVGDDADRVVVKINRVQSVFGFPMRWGGRWLASREAAVFERMAGVVGVPRMVERVGETGIAHVFVPGEPLAPGDTVGEDFLNDLERLVAAFHERGIAIVDLQKPENLLRGDDGRPYLFDFQIAWTLPRRGLGRSWPMRRLHRIALNGDLYHLRKHRYRFLRDTLSEAEIARLSRRPWYIRLHRGIARPFQVFRRGLLVSLGIRTRDGKAQSELHVEPGIAKRREN